MVKKISSWVLLLLLADSFSMQAQIYTPCPDELIPRYSKDKRMWGYSDLFGMMILEPIYTKVSPFKENMAVVQKGELSGVINCDGMVIIPLQYERLTDFRNGKVWALKNGLWGLLDNKGRVLIAHQYPEITPILDTELCWVTKDKKWGLVDESKGKIVCPLQYDMAQIISANASLVKSGDYYGVANHVNCNYLLPLNLEHVKRISKYELLFQQNKKWGIFHISGKMISEPQYDSIGLLQQNLFVVKKDNKYGFIDQQGLVKLPIEYDALGEFSYGYCSVAQNGLYGFATRWGKVYIPLIYDAVKPFVSSQTAVMKNGKWGIIDIKNQTVVPFEYDDISVNEKGTLWVLSKSGKYQVLPIGTKDYTWAQQYDKVYANDSTSIIRVVRDNQFYFYNSTTHHLAFNTAYEEADMLYEGYARVRQLNKYGIINATGTPIILLEFQEIKTVENTKQKEWLVKKNGLWGLRTPEKILWPETFEWVYPTGKGLFKVKQGGKYGVVNYQMQTLGDIVYDDISFGAAPEWPAVVTKSKKKGLLQHNGKLITPTKYDSMSACGEGYFKAFSGKTLSLVNPNGEAMKTKWSELTSFSEGFIAFKVNAKWGYANSSLLEVVPVKYDKAGLFFRGLAPVTFNGKAGVISKSGKWIIEPDYDGFIQKTSDKAIFLLKGNKQYAVNERGKVLMMED